jgi:hypothetical protein
MLPRNLPLLLGPPRNVKLGKKDHSAALPAPIGLQQLQPVRHSRQADSKTIHRGSR